MCYFLNEKILIAPTDFIEYIYCPRFIYFMKCLNIPQHEEKRFKVLKGRTIHIQKSITNKDYLRKRIGVIKKEREVYLSSERHHLKGIVDEVLTLDDGTMAPLDYKFMEYRDIDYNTHKMQSLAYGILISENYGVEVNRGYVVYTRSSNKLVTIEFKDKDYKKLEEIIEEMIDITLRGYFPRKTPDRVKCLDCTYNRICV